MITGGSMTKDNEIVYIDSDTYYQIIGSQDEESYKNFLINNPRFKDINSQRKSVYSENIVAKPVVEESKKISEKTKLQCQHEKDEDYRYFPHRFWLEQYLPRFEMTYGKFFYSSDNLTNKAMCEELLIYYSEVCHIDNIENIKKGSLRGIQEFFKKGKSR